MSATLENQHPVFVVGGRSLIGRHLATRLLKRGILVVSTSRRLEQDMVELDLSSDISAWDIPFQPSVAVLCAAVTSLEECRKHPQETFFVNVTNTVRLAEKLLRRGCRIVFLSTNLVFDGSTANALSSAPTCPRTEYGHQKAEAERQLLQLAQNVCVVRLTKVVHRDMKLLADWREALGKRQPIHPFSDLKISPIPVNNVLDILERIVSRRVQGILHVPGATEVTYAEFALRLANRLGAGMELVQPIRIAESKIFLEHVPQHTTLDANQFRDELQLEPADLETVIASV